MCSYKNTTIHVPVAAETPNMDCEWFAQSDTEGTSSDQVVVQALTVTECMRLCQDVTCASLSYDTDSNECRFHSLHTGDITLSSGDTWVTYDYYCFEGGSFMIVCCVASRVGHS